MITGADLALLVHDHDRGHDEVGGCLADHLDRIVTLLPCLRGDLGRIAVWGRFLADHLLDGRRLVVAGNGGSAALAAHLVAELVGRYHDERPPFSALLLSADAATTTALVNDYDPVQVFARQVRAHGRPGDVFLAMSTSGRSPNLVAAAQAAAAGGMTVLAMTGAGPNPVSSCAHDAVVVDSADTPAVQEVQQVVVHLLCEAFDATVAQGAAT